MIRLLAALVLVPLLAAEPIGTNTRFSMPAPSSLAEWQARSSVLKAQILAAAGLLPMPSRTPPAHRIFGRLERKGYSVEKVWIESLPGYYLCGNLYRPLAPRTKLPGILVAHGHWEYGRLEEQPLYSGQTLAANLALQGYVAFAYDMVGYNDTTQTSHEFDGPAERLWSFTPLSLQLWNSTRALDFLQSLAGVDPARIGMTGASGGGTQTFLLAAVDDRIRYAAPVNMISGIMQGGDVCENAPALRYDTNNVELAALIAPRPMLMVSATGDWTRNTPSAEYPAMRRIYSLFSAANNVSNVHVDAPHNFNRQSREAVYAFFARHLRPAATAEDLAEKAVEVEKLQDLLVFHGISRPPNALDYQGVFAAWKRLVPGRTPSDPAAAKLRLQRVLGAQWPESAEGRVTADSVLLTRPGRPGQVSGRWFPGTGTPLVVAGPSAASDGLRTSGRPVLILHDPLPAPDSPFSTTFNRTLDGNRVQDLLTSAAWLRSQGHPVVELTGDGRAAIACLFASALSPAGVRSVAPLPPDFTGADSDFTSLFPVPGIQSAGGLAAAKSLAGRPR